MSRRRKKSKAAVESPVLEASSSVTSATEDNTALENVAPGEEEELDDREEEEPLDPLLINTEQHAVVPEILDEDDVSLVAEEEPFKTGERGSVALIPAGKRDLARYDALQAYFDQLKRYPLLTPEEEHQLAVRYTETGDLGAARRLVTANLRLVVKIAHEYSKAYQNLLDLIQEGNIGLMHAVRKFDPYRGVRLTSYSAWWIRAYILKFILNNWRLVKIGTTQVQRKLFFNLHKEMDQLKAMGIEHPGPKLLAERLSVPEKEVVSMQKRLAGSDVSLDAPLRKDDDGSVSRIDFVKDRAAGPEQEVVNREFSAILRDKLAIFRDQLKGRDKVIFELRTLAEEPLTLQEIGDRYGITRERARQIEQRMMVRLREYLRQELGDAVEVAREEWE